MNERTIQHDYVMKYLCGREEDGGLGYRETANNIVSNDLFIPAHLAEFVSKSEPKVWSRLLALYKQDERQLLNDLKEEIKTRLLMSQNAATFFNKNRTINFAGESVPLYYVSGSELRGDEDFKKNIFAAVEESSHTVMANDNRLYTLRPDITFYLNGIFIGYMELKFSIMGQTAVDNGRGKVVKDYLSTIKEFVQVEKTNENLAKNNKRAVHAIFEKAIHLTASDINETYIIRNIASLYDFAHAKLAADVPAAIEDIATEFLKIFKQYPITSHALTEQQRFEKTMVALYSKKMIEKEILYYNFMEYKFERAQSGKRKVSHDPRLISPRPKQKFGCDKIMERIVEMLSHESEPNYYMNKLRAELTKLDIPQSKIEEIILKREKYCNNKYVYSLLMQYAAGFGKSNIIGWTALQLKDFRYNGEYAYDKIMLVVDRLQLRDQLDTTMMNMNIDKSMFIEATDKKTFVEALDSPRRIIVVNIQKFLDLQQAIDESGKKLKTMRVAFLIDEIHRSNSGETNQEMINLFERLQDSFRKEDGVQVVKKNLLIGFTATPSEDTLARFGEFKSASIVPLWVPFDSYTMKEAIEDGYILDPTKNIYPYAVPVKFDSVEIDEELINEDEPVKIRQSKTSVYSYEPRIRKIAEFVVDRLVSLVYGKIRGEGKAMLAVSSIPNAIKYIEIIRNLYAEKCKQKQYEKYADAPICIVYSDSQSYQNCASLNGGKSESAVIQDFKQSKNGLIIVVDKLQTGFDEPKLHTLFLDKEISDINAIQTISRVNRTCKNKFECHIIDCSWHNVNMQNIKTAFKKYCDIAISDFNPEEQAKSISKFYRELCASDIYKNWFEQFTKNAEDTSFILKMEDGFRVWIRQCIERESAIKKQNAENGWIEGMPEYQTPENEARDLRLLIGEYSSAIESVKNIYDIDSRYYNEQFLLFWQIYCRIFREATRKRNDDDVYVVEPVDIDDSGFTLVETEAEEPKVSGKGGAKPQIKEPKGKTISDVIKLIAKLNEEEGISVQCVQEWLKEIGLFFQSLMEDNTLCALLKDANFTEEDKNKKFHDALFSYCRRTLRKRSDVSDVERLVRLIKENEEQLRASFLQQLMHPSLEPDYNFDTTDIDTPPTINDLIAQAEQLFNPTYDASKVKAAMQSKFADTFSSLCGKRYRDLDIVIDAFFTIVNMESIDDLDGINESVPDNINKYFFAKNSSTSLRNIFKGLLLDLEPYLRKICYLEKGTIFGTHDGFVAVVREIRALNNLYYTDEPELSLFKTFYNTVYAWRNDNAHMAPKLPENELEPAIYMVLCIYLYATMVSITNLKFAGVDFNF